MEIHSINLRSRRLTVLTSAVAVVVTFVLLMAYQYVSVRRQLSEEIRAEAAIIGANSSAALVFRDEKAALETLSAIRLVPRAILGGALYTEDGALFASAQESSDVFPARVPPYRPGLAQPVEAHRDFLTNIVREEVFQGETHAGTLLLQVTYSPLYVHLLEFAASVVMIGLFGFLIARQSTEGLRRKMALTEGQVRQMALYDQLTQLPNRSFFEYELDKSIAQSKREDRLGALLFVDVDDFKKVNDLSGHQVGDQVLIMIAERLKRTVRNSDILARVGGDEFVAILVGCRSAENAAKIAEQMIDEMRSPFPTEPIPSHVGLSIGIAMIPTDGDDAETLLRWADMAMYEAKTKGKNQYQFFSESINDAVHGKLRIEAALRDALRESDSGLWLAYQPQVDAKTRELVGVEALMRWRRATGENVPPGEFIPIAEKTGLIVELGAWLIRQICRDVADFRRQGLVLPKVSVNISPRELARGSTVVDSICATLVEAGEPVSLFQYELTENALMDDRGGDVLDAFRRAGFSLAIDDFGSGYSSLGYLKRYDVSTLKIDRQFVEHLPEDSEDAAIVTAVIQMSRALGIATVAEGVETEAQARFLAERGCDILQGYHISRPLSPDDLVRFAGGCCGVPDRDLTPAGETLCR